MLETSAMLSQTPLSPNPLAAAGAKALALWALTFGRIGARPMALSSVLVAGLSGCNGVPGDGTNVASPEQPQMAAAKVENRYSSSTKPGSYIIGPMDVLQITVYKSPDLSKVVPVAEDGSINLPLIGATPAAGKTASELEREIQKRLDAEYMRSPQTNVMVKEYNSRRVTVEGAVNTPGVFGLRGRDTLEQAIAKAGGVDRGVSSDSVTVFRNVNGARTMIPYDLAAIRNGQAEDPEVVAGDVIVVGENAAKVGFSLLMQGLPIARTGQSAATQATK
jgi:polysaccharide export outer membrane protein